MPNAWESAPVVEDEPAWKSAPAVDDEPSFDIFENLPKESVQSIQKDADDYNRLLSGLPPESAKEILEIAEIKSGRTKDERMKEIMRKNAVKRMAGIEKVRLKNPTMADEIENMGAGEANLIAMGEGFASIGRGLGLMDEADETQKMYDDALRSQYPMSEVSKAAGQAAPLVPLGIGAGAIPSTVGRVAAMGGVGGLEGGLITKGEGGSPGEVALGAGVGTTLGAGGELVIPYATRAARRLFDRLRGKEPEAPLITPEGQPTEELQKVLDEANLSFDEMLKEYQSPQNVTRDIAEGAQLDEKSLSRRLDEIVASSAPSEEKLAAARQLGIKEEDIPPGVLTDSQSFAELSGALSAVPGSVASESLDQFTNILSRRADDLVEEMGGALDKGAVSDRLKTKIQANRDALYEAEGAIYDEINELIPDDIKVNTKPMVSEMDQEIVRMGGVKELDPHSRKVYLLLKRKPTYARLDRERKSIGAALGKKEGPYKDAETATLSRLYSQLTELQGGVASQFGNAKNLWDEAKKIGVRRKAVEENSRQLFGRDLARGIIPSLESGLKKLPKGDYKQFNEIMNAIPKEERASVLSTALNGVFTGSRSPNKSLTATEYTKWFDSLKRSPKSYKAVKDNLPEGGMERLEALNKISEGLADVTRKRTRTGIVKTVFDDFDKADGWIAKLYNFADKSPVGVSQTARVTSNIAKMAAKQKDPSVRAADKLLASPAFRRAFFDAANDPGSAAARRAQNALEKSKAYQEYVKSQEKPTQEAIASLGLIPWLLSEEEE